MIDKVLNDGLPSPHYEEVELLREGGGPNRQPRAILHNYYYNGNRIFQGPAFPGGPTEIHVTHPRSGEACVFHINMPTGTPFIEYSKSSIEYYFPDIVVELNFRRSGGYDIDYRTMFNKYARERRKFLSQRLRSRQAVPGSGTTDTAANALGVGLGAPLNIASRLPFLSDLFRRRDNRQPATLKMPRRTSN